MPSYRGVCRAERDRTLTLVANDPLLAGCVGAIQVEREAGRARIAQLGAELQAWDQIVAAILPPVAKRCRAGERPHPLAQASGDVSKASLIEAIGAINHEGREHIVAGIKQDAVMDRE